MNKKSVVCWTVGILAVLCVLFIWGNSMASGEDSGEMSGSVTKWINGALQKISPSWEVSHKFVRKAAHFTEFAILGALLTVNIRAFFSRRIGFVLYAIPCAFVVASIDEVIQLFVKGRSCSLLDVMLDTLGATVAVAIAFAIFYIIEKTKKKRVFLPMLLQSKQNKCKIEKNEEGRSRWHRHCPHL